MADEEATIPTPPVEQEGQNSERWLYCTIDIWLVGFPIYETIQCVAN